MLLALEKPLILGDFVIKYQYYNSDGFMFFYASGNFFETNLEKHWFYKNSGNSACARILGACKNCHGKSCIQFIIFIFYRQIIQNLHWKKQVLGGDIENLCGWKIDLVWMTSWWCKPMIFFSCHCYFKEFFCLNSSLIVIIA